MKHSQAPIPIRSDDRPLGFWDCIRWATLLTLCVTAITFVIAAVQCYIEVWAIAAGLWFLAVLAVGIGTLTVGCLVMIPVEFWRHAKRHSGENTAKTAAQKLLWDRWIDGPEPL